MNINRFLFPVLLSKLAVKVGLDTETSQDNIGPNLMTPLRPFYDHQESVFDYHKGSNARNLKMFEEQVSSEYDVEAYNIDPQDEDFYPLMKLTTLVGESHKHVKLPDVKGNDGIMLMEVPSYCLQNHIPKYRENPNISCESIDDLQTKQHYLGGAKRIAKDIVQNLIETSEKVDPDTENTNELRRLGEKMSYELFSPDLDEIKRIATERFNKIARSGKLDTDTYRYLVDKSKTFGRLQNEYIELLEEFDKVGDKKREEHMSARLSEAVSSGKSVTALVGNGHIPSLRTVHLEKFPDRPLVVLTPKKAKEKVARPKVGRGI